MVPEKLDWGGGGKAVAVGSGGACVCVVIELETCEPRHITQALGHDIVQARHAGGHTRESPEAMPGVGHGRGRCRRLVTNPNEMDTFLLDARGISSMLSRI